MCNSVYLKGILSESLLQVGGQVCQFVIQSVAKWRRSGGNSSLTESFFWKAFLCIGQSHDTLQPSFLKSTFQLQHLESVFVERKSKDIIHLTYFRTYTVFENCQKMSHFRIFTQLLEFIFLAQKLTFLWFGSKCWKKETLRNIFKYCAVRQSHIKCFFEVQIINHFFCYRTDS